ncbi:MAG: hypothetical protein EA001_11490 [Oscillatoriales cyanobacterium]|nr:MAG: hypothetical protein EA001_11490 [Oscillatoriales cyanobacterium]
MLFFGIFGACIDGFNHQRKPFLFLLGLTQNLNCPDPPTPSPNWSDRLTPNLNCTPSASIGFINSLSLPHRIFKSSDRNPA